MYYMYDICYVFIRGCKREHLFSFSYSFSHVCTSSPSLSSSLSVWMDKTVGIETLRLLSTGHTMLGKGCRCPECGGALFRSKESAACVICPACVVREKERTRGGSPTPSAPHLEEEREGEGEIDVVMEGRGALPPLPSSSPTSSSSQEQEQDQPYITPCDRDEACHRLGELLLKHWRMLAEECPRGCHVPLMQQREDTPALCVACLALVFIQQQ